MLPIKRVFALLCVCVQLFSNVMYLISTVSATTGTTQQGADDEFPGVPSSFRIAGYLPDYRFGIDLNSTALLLDDLYLFSLAPQPQLGEMIFAVCCLNQDHYEKAHQAVAYAKQTIGKDVKIWVTVGGGGRSASFTKNPSAMISALQVLLTTQNFDGVDFDCELFRSHQDYDDYDALLKSAAYVLHKLGKQVSVALHVGQFLTKDIYNAVDRVNLMAYDMVGSSYHADYGKTRDSVEKLIQSGCPAHKIFLGLPAYGRHRIHQSEAKTYSELIDIELQRGKTFDEFRTTYEIDEYIFDSPAAISAKVRLAIKEGLGGVFFWELGQDKRHESAPSGILLTAAARQVKEATPSEINQTTSSSTTTARTAEIYKTLNNKDEL
jgi:chitinase